jgi:hypothetical protein
LEKLEGKTAELGEFHTLKKQILKNLKDWYELTSQTEINEERAGTIINRQNQLIRRLGEFKNTSPDNPFNNADLNRAKSAYASWFSRSNNSASIVLQNEEKGLLMSADVEKSIIDNYLVGRFYNKNYEIIKVPHHGTANHHSVNLPEANTFLISSGKRTRFGKVGLAYKKHRDANGERKCTACDTWCEIIDTGKRCINPSCSNDEVDILL